jgi:hypothetical protein
MRIIDPSEVADAIANGHYEVDNAPLQIPGRDTIVQKVKIAGPRTKLDTRMYWDCAELEGLMAIAKASRTTRLEMVMVGLEVTTFQAKSGHNYQVWKLEAGIVRPETGTIVG